MGVNQNRLFAKQLHSLFVRQLQNLAVSRHAPGRAIHGFEPQTEDNQIQKDYQNDGIVGQHHPKSCRNDCSQSHAWRNQIDPRDNEGSQIP